MKAAFDKAKKRAEKVEELKRIVLAFKPDQHKFHLEKILDDLKPFLRAVNGSMEKTSLRSY